MPTTNPAAPEHAAPKGHTNRLIGEKSPYLLQHAHNPVDWYPWGPEAFAAAREQNKPIFLSIGYSTCYWCHVMERESFENESIAALMNQHFISIKVDREERPDVDEIYMAATQIFNNGQGGWPMSLFLDPGTLKPFLAGTYFPPEDSPQLGRVGFRSLLNNIEKVWAEQRELLVRQADQLAQLVTKQLSQASWARAVGRQDVERAVNSLLGIYDRKDGGFGQGSNKFPMPVYLDMLMGAAWDREEVRLAVLHTLDRMALGGMYDQVGGGFHRYSTDRKWLVPHFEKMLYDNGQLASTYSAAYELTGDSFYAEIVRETLDYVLREMTGTSGAFYSAQDAEVDAREGGSYIWVTDQVRDALNEAGLDDDTEFALEIYGFKLGTNFRDPHHPADGWKNVAYLVDKPQALAERSGMSIDRFNERVDRINAALLAVRDNREQPGTDDKVLAGWNGLMIAGMADGGRVLADDKYVQAARRAADFVLTTLRTGDGGLLRAYRDGTAKVDAFLEDYAMMIKGLVALHRATGDTRWRDEAETLVDAARTRFWDPRFDGYFDTLADQSDLFVRTKSIYDGAVPSGNALMLNNLLDLHDLTGKQQYLDDATATLRSLSNAIADSPGGAVVSILALHRFVHEQPDRLAWGAATKPQRQVVTIELSTTRIEVAEGRPAELELSVTIADGYHINAHDPGLANLVGLTVQLVGAEGLVAASAYPAGERYQDEILVHRGTVKVPVMIAQQGPVGGEPQLAVTYQVCTDKVCLMPATAMLPLEIVTGATP